MFCFNINKILNRALEFLNYWKQSWDSIIYLVLNEIFFNYCPEWIFTNRTLYLDTAIIIPEDPTCSIENISEFNIIVLEGIARFHGGNTDFYFIKIL